jgi:hypothetical protein
MLWATETMAATIGFGDLHGSNLSAFTSYQESGYTVAATGGQWFEAHIFGNGVPAIGAGPVYNAEPGAPQTITVTEVAGGLFTFGGVDLTSNSAVGMEYTIAGFRDLNTVAIFTTTFSIGSINHFESKLFSRLADVNRLTITGTRHGGVTSFNIDNIQLTAANDPGPPGPGCTAPRCPDPNVPEPASLLLLGVGLAGIEVWRRKWGEG